MNIVVIRDTSRLHLGGYLNIKELLNPLFYDGAWPVGVRHPDMKRQASRRLLSITRRRERALKAQAVPLYLVDPTVVLESQDWDGRTVYELRNCGFGSTYRNKVRSMSAEVGE